MSTEMSALNSSSIKYAEFVKITTPDEVVTFCNAAASISVNGTTYTGMGSYLGISEIQQDIKANSNDLKLSVTGLETANIALILSSNAKGSILEVYRGFLDSNNQIITFPTQQFFRRYKGIINNIAINENFDSQSRQRVATCIFSCASIRTVLDNRIAGIRTNQSNWQFLYPTDTSMDRVSVIASTYFDFGKQTTTASQSSALKAAISSASRVIFKPTSSAG